MCTHSHTKHCCATTLHTHTLQVLDYLLGEMETHRDSLVVAFAGYKKDMDKLFEYNEGLPSRFPKTLSFPDYTDEQLLAILCGLMASKKSSISSSSNSSSSNSTSLRISAAVDGDDRWAKVAVARIGRLRGTRGFGNARAVRTLFDQVCLTVISYSSI
jgi:Cdc6-like AAA superfamily ATPase